MRISDWSFRRVLFRSPRHGELTLRVDESLQRRRGNRHRRREWNAQDRGRQLDVAHVAQDTRDEAGPGPGGVGLVRGQDLVGTLSDVEIGRATGRERVGQYV